MTLPKFKSTPEAEREALFWRGLKEGQRLGYAKSYAEAREVAGRNLTVYWNSLESHWHRRHGHLNTDFDRKYAREEIERIRWSTWQIRFMERPDVRAEIDAGPSCVLLRWRGNRYKEDGILDSAGNLVAEVLHEREHAPGPTFRAVIYKPPFKYDVCPSLYAREDEFECPPRDELDWALVRTRAKARAWLVDTLHRRCIAVWGNEIDLPERT